MDCSGNYGREGSIGIVTTWGLHIQSTGLLKVVMLLGFGVVPSICSSSIFGEN